MLGCGEWSAHLARRGGSPVNFDIPFGALTMGRIVNATSGASCSIPLAAPSSALCCEILNEVQPWRDELVLYRDRELVWVGPVTSVSIGAEGGTINATDLFGWMERRVVQEDMTFSGDAADMFRDLLEYAIALDPSINLEVVINEVGHSVVRRIEGKDAHVVTSLLSELARSAVDYTVLGRRVLAGDVEALLPPEHLVLHDDGCRDAEVTKAGDLLATDVTVFGQTLSNATRPVTGRAIRGVQEYGLLQTSFAELLIDDDESAQRNSEGRLEAMQPAPLQVTATLNESAQPTFGDLVPSRKFNVGLGEVAGCITVNQEMRLHSMDVDVDVSDGGNEENVRVALIPVGLDARA